MQTVSKSGRGYRTWLLDELSKRRAKNPSYSVRAFARDLGVGNSSLAGVLGNRRTLSKKNALGVAKKLLLSPQKTNRLLQEIGYRPDREAEGQEFLTLAEDTFTLISHWYYFGIVNLCKFGSNKGDPSFFARRLGISRLEAVNAIERLVRLKLLIRRDGELRPSTATISTTRDVPSAALRKYHRQNLEKAAEAMEQVPVSLRDISAITFPADLSRYQEATNLIMAFKRKVARLLESGEPTEVYTLAIQLFPISKPVQENEK